MELVGDVGPHGRRYYGHADGVVGRAVAEGLSASVRRLLVVTDRRLVQRFGCIGPGEVKGSHYDSWVGQGWSIGAVEVQASVWDTEARDVDAVGK